MSPSTRRLTHRSDPTEQFFEELGSRGHEPLLAQVQGSARFDLVNGGRTARWLVTVDRGDITVSRRNSRADCVVRTSKALFDRIASGKANAMAAFLRGEIVVEGDPELLMLIQRLFPGPRATEKRS
jgi:putative sterol carrier protein